MEAPPFTVPSRILFGAAYYAEYHRDDRTVTDLDLMQQAGFTVIRVGESVWSTWEPRDNEFDLDWLQPVLDGAHERGISVILGTPTYAVPPWLQAAYPEIAAEQRTGEPTPWGARQEVDYSHPAFLFHAERVIRAVISRYADHPAVIGYQVDNEPGMLLFHNRGAFRRFVGRLKAQYGDVETLNREWGLTYWSHRLSDWSDLWTPDGNTLPQYDLAWRRFQADLTTEFIAWQAGIVREYARPGQFVTTCIAYPRPAIDDEALVAALEVTSGNPYYAMQDHLDLTKSLDSVTPWTTSGVPGLFRQADRLFSSNQSRFFVTETDAQSIGGPEFNLPPYPGQLRQAAFALISRGASLIEYWHWHSLPYGTETYWGGVLPHSLVPGRVYAELSEVGAELGRHRRPTGRVRARCGRRDPLVDRQPVRAGIQSDLPRRRRHTRSRVLPADLRRVPPRASSTRARRRGSCTPAQARELGAVALAERYPVLVAPALYVATDADLDLLRDYAAAGGHLVIGIRTGYGDEEARARVAVAPDRLHAAAGVHYEEFSNLHHDVEVDADAALTLSESAVATRWADGLITDGADVLVRYRHPRFSDFAAVTTHAHVDGRITVVGTVPSPALAADLVRWLVPAPIADELTTGRAPSITISSGALPDGRRAWFVFNWSGDEAAVTLARAVTDPITAEKHAAATELSLAPWSTLTLIDE